jgi:RNAse (barnase) inhibitor barstar
VKIENVNDVPISFEFAQIKDNDPSKMEGFLMEDVHIPLNLRFVHLATEEGDVMIRK